MLHLNVWTGLHGCKRGVTTLSDQDKLQFTREATLEQLMKEYGTRILRLVYLFVKDRSLAEDIAQEVFVKVYRHLPDFRGESSIQTWLYRIAVNECKGHLRSWSFRNIFPRSIIQQAGYTTVEQSVMETEERADIARQVITLSPLYRQVIALHYYEDLTIAEIAEVLGTSEGTVRTRLHRARHQLKERIREGVDLEWI